MILRTLGVQARIEGSKKFVDFGIIFLDNGVSGFLTRLVTPIARACPAVNRPLTDSMTILLVGSHDRDSDRNGRNV